MMYLANDPGKKSRVSGAMPRVPMKITSTPSFSANCATACLISCAATSSQLKNSKEKIKKKKKNENTSLHASLPITSKLPLLDFLIRLVQHQLALVTSLLIHVRVLRIGLRTSERDGVHDQEAVVTTTEMKGVV